MITAMEGGVGLLRSVAVGRRSLGSLQRVSRRIGFLRSEAVGCKYLGKGKLRLGAFVSL